MAEVFRDREKAFEAQFGHDQDLAFRIRARGNRMLGLWVAEALGIAGGGAEEYARSLVTVALEKAGEEGVIRKILTDFQERDVDMTEARLKVKVEKIMTEARDSILHDG